LTDCPDVVARSLGSGVESKEVVENLALHLAEQQRVEFEKKVYFCCKNLLIPSQILEPSLQEQGNPEQTGSIILLRLKQIFNPVQFSLRNSTPCLEEILIELIGPIALMLLQEVSVQVLSPEGVENWRFSPGLSSNELSLRRRQYFCCKNLPFNLK